MTVQYIDRALIVETARAYIGTPFRHQGRVRGAGIDCAGVPIGVAYDLGVVDACITGYDRQPNDTEFRAILDRYTFEIPFQDVLPADMLTFAFLKEQHIAIVTQVDPICILHAYESVGRCVEQPLDKVWLRRMRGCRRFPWAAPMLLVA